MTPFGTTGVRTPFSNYSVTDQSTETVAQDSEIQNVDSSTEWDNATTIGADIPLYVDNGQLKLAQTCWVAEAEDNNNGGGVSISDSNFSEGLDSTSTETRGLLSLRSALSMIYLHRTSGLPLERVPIVSTVALTSGTRLEVMGRHFPPRQAVVWGGSMVMTSQVRQSQQATLSQHGCSCNHLHLATTSRWI